MSANSFPQLPLRRTQSLTVQQLADEVLLYDERTHQAYCLNATTAMVWNTCDGTRTLEQIAALVCPETDALIGEAIVRLALSELAKDHLIEQYAEPTLPVVSRRTMLLKAGAGLALAVPAIAVIAAPRAAQAYSGCFDCSTSSMIEQRRQAAMARQQKLMHTAPAGSPVK